MTEKLLLIHSNFTTYLLSLFIFSCTGDGYTLTVMVSNDSSVTQIQKKVQEHLPQSVLRSAQGGEMTFKLPPSTTHFASLLETLTKQKAQLGIRHVGLSLTSMEQVFLRSVLVQICICSFAHQSFNKS